MVTTLTAIIEDFRNTVLLKTMPYKHSIVGTSMNAAAQSGHPEQIREFIDVYTELLVRARPDKTEEHMKKIALENIAVWAYLGDHNPSPMEWTSIAPVGAYQSTHLHGPSMAEVVKVCAERGLDIVTEVLDYPGQQQ